ncbi:hypothetical protein [Photobacterium aquimaris]|uniref:hypothetical protein n=1 Tax=Photobacterium aquimaris TaxID=512643 RepID=UPI000B1DF382|nr:hypothetical protein [Photobacterium aquimaris]
MCDKEGEILEWKRNRNHNVGSRAFWSDDEFNKAEERYLLKQEVDAEKKRLAYLKMKGK